MSKLFIRFWLTLLKQSIKRLGNDCLRRLRNYKTLVKSVCETASKSLFWALSVYQDVTTRHNRPVRKAMVNLPIKMKGNSWSPLGAQNKDIGSSSQMLLTKVKLRLRRRLGNDRFLVRTTRQPPCVLHCKWEYFFFVIKHRHHQQGYCGKPSWTSLWVVWIFHSHSSASP